MDDPSVLVWQMLGGFSGEDQHRLAHHRLGPILRHRLGHKAPSVFHETGTSEAVVARCIRTRPSVLVLPAFRDHVFQSLEAVRQLSNALPDLPILLSGWGTDPDYVDAIVQGKGLEHPHLALARGEAEEGLVDALELIIGHGTFTTTALEHLGLAVPRPKGGWFCRGRFRCVTNLGSLPSPYLEGALKPEDMGGMVLVEVARGCLFRCHFCLSCNYPNQQPRPFPIQRVLDEVEYAADQQAESIGLLCSGLNYDPDVIEAIADKLNSIPPNRRPAIESTIHLSLLDSRRLRAIHSLPWRRMIVGLQSTNPNALSIMHRHLDIEAFRGAIEDIARSHRPVVELILGLPGDSLQGFLRTLRFVLDLPVELEIYPLRLDPGSWFLRDREKLGLEADFGNQGIVVRTPTFSSEDLERARQAIIALGQGPWPHRARRIGFDFRLIRDICREVRIA